MSKIDTGFSKVHFIGIGGAGMSGIALVLHQRGYVVSGSDLKSSRYTRPLMRAGIDVTIGHDASTIDRLSPEIVVISTAIPATNPELKRARELGLEICPRAKMLSYLSRGSTTLAIAGTHGKTTTSSLVATMLDGLKQSPTFLIGGVIDGFETNGHNGSGPYFVAEADESDGSFLFLSPDYVIITNVEADHLDHYGCLENIEKAFCGLLSLMPEDTGTAIVCGEDPHLLELARSSGRRCVSYGFSAANDVQLTLEDEGVNTFTVSLPADLERVQAPGAVGAGTDALGTDGTGTSAGARDAGTDASTGRTGGTVNVTAHLDHNPGAHNALNGAAAITLGYLLGFDAQACARALSTFSGVHRRFEHVGTVAGITVIDDYGHHPTEIASTLSAARKVCTGRLHVAFQPHRYSRTQALAADFGPAFAAADTVSVTDIFPAGEVPVPGVTGKTVVSSIEAASPGVDAAYVSNRHELTSRLLGLVQPGDMVITMGAGDITMFGPALLEALRAHTAAQ